MPTCSDGLNSTHDDLDEHVRVEGSHFVSRPHVVILVLAAYPPPFNARFS